jgi:hypothetical protein
MTTIRKIVTSKIDGSNANNTDIDEIRPFGETAFYIDNNGATDQLVLSIHDGIRTHQKSKVLSPGVLYGSNADAGDGSNADTIKLIPDASLGTDQYIVVDPTGGEPGHIHLRAGGTQDASGADLYLGGELTNVRVSDPADNVRVRTSFSSEGVTNYDWTFDNTGKLTFPQGGAIEAHGMGWTGLTNGTSGSPLSIAYKSNSESPVGLAEILLIGSNTDGSVNIYTQDTEAGTSNQWTFDEAGETIMPGSVALSSAKIDITTVVSAAGTIINVPLNAAGDTVDYTGGASLIEVPKNADTDQVQAGWVITFNGGVQRTVSGKIDGGSYYAITFNEANPGGTLYPLTIQSSDYVVPVAGKIDLVPDASTPNTKLSFDANGNVALPNGLTIPGGAPSLIVATGNNLGIGTSRYQTQSANCAIAVGDEFVADTEFNDDITVVQVGWTVVVGGTTYTVTAIDPAPPANQYRITAAGATFIQSTTYTFTNPTPVSSTWVFGNDGVLTTPGTGTISHANNDLKVEVSGTDVIVLRTAGGETVLSANGDVLLSNDLVFNNNVKVTTGGQMDQNAINFSVPDSIASSTYYEWSFDASYGMPFLRFPNGTLQSTAWAGGRVVEAPLASTGAEGDQEGDLAFTNDYIYRCVADFGSVPTETFTVVNAGEYNSSIQVNKASNPNYTVPQAGWYVVVGGVTMTLSAFSGDHINGTDYNFLFDNTPGAPLPSTITLISNTGNTNIWKRLAWSGDTW